MTRSPPPHLQIKAVEAASARDPNTAALFFTLQPIERFPCPFSPSPPPVVRPMSPIPSTPMSEAGSALAARHLGTSREKPGVALGLTFQRVQKHERGFNRIPASKRRSTPWSKRRARDHERRDRGRRPGVREWDDGATEEPPLIPEPRGWTAFQVATYLGVSESFLCDEAKRLVDAGFPTPNPPTGRYDRRAIDGRLDRQSGLVGPFFGRTADGDDPFSACRGSTRSASGSPTEARVHHYHRATGSRLPDDPVAPELATRLRELNAESPVSTRPLAGSFQSLVTAYKSAPEFTRLAPKSRRELRPLS